MDEIEDNCEASRGDGFTRVRHRGIETLSRRDRNRNLTRSDTGLIAVHFGSAVASGGNRKT